jgi:hypothetical protein
MDEKEDIPSFAPTSRSDVQNNEVEPTNIDNNDNEQNSEDDKHKEKKRGSGSKKKIVLIVVGIIVLLLGVESLFFFRLNKTGINSYDHLFAAPTQLCNTNVAVEQNSNGTEATGDGVVKPEATPFYNQICATVGDYKFVSSQSNVEALSNGAVEAYILNYQNTTGEKLTLYAATFDNNKKQNEYTESIETQKTLDPNTPSVSWENKNAIYSVFGKDAQTFQSAFNL